MRLSDSVNDQIRQNAQMNRGAFACKAYAAAPRLHERTTLLVRNNVLKCLLTAKYCII